MITDSLDLSAMLARLDKLTNWEAKPRAKMRQGLKAVRSLLSLCGDPQLSMRFVHVTGTKGKGSVCSLLEHAMVAGGLTVGGYYSPHLISVTERISVRGCPIAEPALALLIARVVDRIEMAETHGMAAASATWFDAMTVVALLAFQQAGCEWVVLEVGLGGRFDSTNVAPAEIAVITNVELEHREVLGRDRSEIAYQKSGIIKPGSVLVTPLRSEDEAGRVIHAEAAAAGVRIHLVATGDTTIAASNLAIAGAVLDELGRAVAPRREEGEQVVGRRLLTDDVIRSARLPGRMERLIYTVRADDGEYIVPVVLDGAHVPFNLAAVLRDLSGQPRTGKPCIAVFAIADDKDASSLLAVLSPRVRSLLLTTIPTSARMTTPTSLATVAALQGIDVRVEPCPETALHEALLEAARFRTWVLVTGSLHLVGLLRPLLFRQPGGGSGSALFSAVGALDRSVGRA